MNKKEWLFLVGFMKCGTSSLWAYLKEHPEISVYKEKEPDFWLKENPSKKEIKEYESEFSKGRIKFDASTSYIWDNNAFNGIKKNYPDAKIIIMTRHYPEWLISCFIDRRNQDKNIKDRLEEDYYANPFYRMLDNYQDYIDKWKSCFKVKVINLKDMKKKPEKIIREVLDFIGVKNIKLNVQFNVFNEGGITYRSRTLRFLKRKIPLKREKTPKFLVSIYDKINKYKYRKSINSIAKNKNV